MSEIKSIAILDLNRNFINNNIILCLEDVWSSKTSIFNVDKH